MLSFMRTKIVSMSYMNVSLPLVLQYGVVLGLVFIALIVGGVLAFTFRNDVSIYIFCSMKKCRFHLLFVFDIIVISFEKKEY